MDITGDDYDWSKFRLSEQVDDNSFYRVSPLALINHAEENGRELRKQPKDDHIQYTILSDLNYDENDMTQAQWRLEYGAEFYFDGSAKEFLNIADTELEDAESYARKIAEDIFPELERRTLEYYDKKKALV